LWVLLGVHSRPTVKNKKKEYLIDPSIQYLTICLLELTMFANVLFSLFSVTQNKNIIKQLKTQDNFKIQNTSDKSVLLSQISLLFRFQELMGEV
jgi:hypothetical protein